MVLSFPPLETYTPMARGPRNLNFGLGTSLQGRPSPFTGFSRESLRWQMGSQAGEGSRLSGQGDPGGVEEDCGGEREQCYMGAKARWGWG